LFFLFHSKPITKLANEIHRVDSKFNCALYHVHITEGNYTVGTIKKVFAFRIARISLRRGSKPAKIARETGDRSVWQGDH
jgi:hypothetical protein